MRSFKNFLVLGLMILMIGFFSNCKNIFGPDNNEEATYNAEIIYERDASLKDFPYNTMYLNIEPTERVTWKYWPNLGNLPAEKIAENQYKYIVEKLPANIKLCIGAQDFEMTGETFIINGVKLTNTGKDPNNNPGRVAYFMAKPSGTIIP